MPQKMKLETHVYVSGSIHYEYYIKGPGERFECFLI